MREKLWRCQCSWCAYDPCPWKDRGYNICRSVECSSLCEFERPIYGAIRTVQRSCNQATSTLFGDEMYDESCTFPAGIAVRGSRHLWISAWPSTKQTPQALAWRLAGILAHCA